MSTISLANKYRPKVWEDVTEQKYITTILQNQIASNSIKNVYLFCGGAGTGKTTTARIFANELNHGKGTPIEIDSASNNSVDDIRRITQEAMLKSMESEYKVYILDEVHMVTTAGFNAMLKLIEEPPKSTVFILCTTDPQKIPATILSRVQRYDFTKISFEGIVKRLKTIIDRENEEILQNTIKQHSELATTNPAELDKLVQQYLITYDIDLLQYIAKLAEGGMRDAISLLDKCLSYSIDLTMTNGIAALGISDYSSLQSLLDSILNKQVKECITIIENVYNSGKDLKQFIKQEISFILDISKYILFNSYQYIQIPNTIDLKQYTTIDYNSLLNILDLFIALNNTVKYESNPKTLFQSKIILMCRG
nr:MAG TPA: DNA polymerase III [Caudoviricetes sp.]